jgi:hypothetical protein
LDASIPYEIKKLKRPKNNQPATIDDYQNQPTIVI